MKVFIKRENIIHSSYYNNGFLIILSFSNEKKLRKFKKKYQNQINIIRVHKNKCIEFSVELYKIRILG